LVCITISLTTAAAQNVDPFAVERNPVAVDTNNIAPLPPALPASNYDDPPPAGWPALDAHRPQVGRDAPVFVDRGFAPVGRSNPGHPVDGPPEVEQDVVQPHAPQYSRALRKPAKHWADPLFDSDFRDKYDPDHIYLFADELKNVLLCSLGPGARISTGGELRFRHMNEDNRLRPNGPARSTYDLWRWRHYVDFHFADHLRVYVELLDASIVHEDLPPTGIDLNRWNIQNAFVDVHVTHLAGHPLVFRGGRQELLYGSQRLISPLDWVNTRRNFEGFKLLWHADDWQIDAWATRPVNTAAGNGPLFRFDNERDRGDTSRTFNGVFAVYGGIERQTFDMYWLWDRETDALGTGVDRSRHTAGGRWLSEHPVYNDCCEVTRIWRFDVEGGYQFGHEAGETVRAGFFTAGVGHTWKSHPWSPTLWLFYDWASGDDDPSDGENNTFNHLFPLGHAYIGLIDNVARQNLSDVNWRLTVNPTQKLTLLAAMHWMDLDTSNDLVYNVAGRGLGQRNVGDEIGEELDLVATYRFHPNFTVQAGYFWFWYGSAIRNSPLRRDDASQFYLQTVFQY
jgi:hypothetical protein